MTNRDLQMLYFGFVAGLLVYSYLSKPSSAPAPLVNDGEWQRRAEESRKRFEAERAEQEDAFVAKLAAAFGRSVPGDV